MKSMFSKRPVTRWLVGAVCSTVLLLAGCGDFFTKDGGGGGGGGGTGTVGSYTYVGTQGGVLTSYSVSSTGALTTLSGSPFQLTTAAINGLAVTPANTFLYAGIAGGGVFGLGINSSSGVPSLLSTSALVQDVAPIALAIDPAGTHLLVAGLANGTAAVGEYAINSDGTLSEVGGSPVSVTFTPGTDTTNLAVSGMAIAPNSSYVFVTLGQLGIAPMPFNTSGSLSPNTVILGPKATSGVANQDLGVAVNPTSSALFVGETNVGVRVFTIGSNSAFTEISGSPFAAGGQPRALSFDGTGNYLYAANAAGNTISGYTVLASGSLTPISGSPFSSVGEQPNALALDQSKKFLIDANLDGTPSGTPDVQVFSVDATTPGKLDPGATATNASTAAAVASTH
jgi:6-phosphogluconolactonase